MLGALWFFVSLSVVCLIGLFIFHSRGKQMIGQNGEPVEIVSDMDAILTRSVGFVFQKKTYVIHPIIGERFFRMANAMAEAQMLASSEKVIKDVDMLLDAYAKMFQIACPKIKRKHVAQMDQAQVSNFVNMIMMQMMGAKMLDEEKKSPNPADFLELAKKTRASWTSKSMPSAS